MTASQKVPHPADEILSTDIEHIIPSRYHTTGDIKDVNTFTAKDVAEHMTKWLKHIFTQKEIKVRVVGAAELRVMEDAMRRADAILDKDYVVLKDDIRVTEVSKPMIIQTAEPKDEEIMMELAIMQAYRQGLADAKQKVWLTYKDKGHSLLLSQVHDQLLDLTYEAEQRMTGVIAGIAAPLSSPVRHWVHVKSGGGYREIARGKLQHKAPNVDMTDVVVYAGMDGRVWVRPAEEFNDGRFEIVVASKSWYRKMIDKLWSRDGTSDSPKEHVQS